MSKLAHLWQQEPTMVIAAVQTLIALGVAFGIDLTANQTGAILAALAAIMGVVTRSQVSSTAALQALATPAQQLKPADAGNADLDWILRVFALAAMIIVGLMGAHWFLHSGKYLFAWLGFGWAAWFLIGFSGPPRRSRRNRDDP